MWSPGSLSSPCPRMAAGLACPLEAKEWLKREERPGEHLW